MSKSAPTKVRVYVVNVGGKERLVRATYGHIAERHVISTIITSRVASKDDLIDLLQAGVRVEDAAENPDQGELDVDPDPQPQQPLALQAEPA